LERHAERHCGGPERGRAGDRVVCGVGKPGRKPAGGQCSEWNFCGQIFGADGSYRWSLVTSGTAGYGIVADPTTANIFVTGQGSSGFFLNAYDPNGGALWNYTLGNSGNAGYAIAVDGSGNLALTGNCGYVGWACNNPN